MLEETILEKLAYSRVTSVPATLYYFPNFISEDEEASLISHIKARPWHELKHRRLQVYPSQLTHSNVLLTNNPLPPWLSDPLHTKLDRLGIFKDTSHGRVNHILVNSYSPGEGILPHEDGPAYAPVTATISLSSPAILDLYAKIGRSGDMTKIPVHRIYQEPRSLLVTRDEAYQIFLHGIAEKGKDENVNEHEIANWSLLADGTSNIDNNGVSVRKERISLTCRDVVKVSSLGSRIFGKKA